MYRRFALGDDVPPSGGAPTAVPTAMQPAGGAHVDESVLPADAASGLQDLQSSLRPRTAPVEAFDIMPPEASALRVPQPAASIPANQIGVAAFPFTELTDTQLRGFFEAIYGSGAGGPALLQTLTQGFATPNFVAMGFAPYDSPGPGTRAGTQSRGAAWLAFGWASAQTGQTFKNFVAAVARSALTAIGATAGLGNPALTVPIVAAGSSDRDLIAAATSSAVGTVTGLDAIATALLTPLGLPASFRAPKSTQFETLTGNVTALRDGITAAAGAPAALDAAEMAIRAARAAPRDQAPQMQTALTQVKTALGQLQSKVDALPAAASNIQQFIASEQTSEGSFARSVRDDVVRQTQDDINKLAHPVQRAYGKYARWQLAQRYLDGTLRTVSSIMQDGSAASSAVMNARDALGKTSRTIGKKVQKIDKTISDLPLGDLERHYFGLPGYVWLAGGTVTAVGGVLVLARWKKKRRAAAAGVTANRRRRHRRTSR